MPNTGAPSGNKTTQTCLPRAYSSARRKDVNQTVNMIVVSEKSTGLQEHIPEHSHILGVRKDWHLRIDESQIMEAEE